MNLEIHNEVRRANRRRPPQTVLPVPNSSNGVRHFLTFCLFVAFFGMGTAAAMLGPTLLDLAANASTSLQSMSYIFIARSLGHLTGSFAGGLLYDKCNSHSLILSASCLASAVMMFLAPVGNSIYFLAAVFFLKWNFLGCLDTGCNALILNVWETKSRPYMQALHFTFASGAFLSPIIVEPFLSNQSDSNATDYHMNTTSLPSVSMAYWLGLIPLLVAGLGFLCSVCKTKWRIRKPVFQLISKNRTQSSQASKVVIIFLFFLFVMLSIGREVAYSGYLFTFGVKSTLQMSKDDAAYLLSSFWGSFALSRLAAVPLSHYIKPVKLLLLDIIGCLLGSGLLALQFIKGCSFADTTALWVGTILLGISMASVFPTTVSWAEYHFEVSGQIASILICAAGFGEMSIPFLVANLFATIGPCVLMLTTLAVNVLTLLLFIVIVIYGKATRNKHDHQFELTESATGQA